MKRLFYIAFLLVLVSCNHLIFSCSPSSSCTSPDDCLDGQICLQLGICSFCPLNKPSKCENTCVNELTDNNNCGSCAFQCSGQLQCLNGLCQCPTHFSHCDGKCVVLQNDPKNCGRCGNVCEKDEYCSDGVCTQKKCSELNKQLTTCGRSCVNTQDTPNHCGECNKSCSDRRVCRKGRCLCPEGELPCGGKCVNRMVDWENCGTCANQCPKGTLCSQGKCVATCPKGTPNSCFGGCFNLDKDDRHCGRCGNTCRREEKCIAGRCRSQCVPNHLKMCDGKCTDVLNHPEHCGNCHYNCLIFEHCVQGRCVCAKGTQKCGGSEVCIDLQYSEKHCGKCGNKCSPSERCEKGKCVINCISPQIPCSKECVDVTKNPKHCGTCAKSCSSSQICKDGKCVCPEKRIFCANACVDTSVNAEHCGRCGIKCAKGLFCIDGQCSRCPKTSPICGQDCCPKPLVCVKDKCINLNQNKNCGLLGRKCQIGELCCNGRCVNTQDHPGHCGQCTKSCTAKQDCTKTACVPAKFWAKRFGNSGIEQASALAVAPNGDVYVTGEFSGTMHFGKFKEQSFASASVYVIKLDKTGEVVWAFTFATNKQEYAFGKNIKLDKQGGVVVIGHHVGALSIGNLRLGSSGKFEAFVLKLSSLGKPLWVQSIQGSGDDKAVGLDVDANGNIAVSGNFTANTKVENTTLNAFGKSETFVVKLDSKGTLLWAKSFGSDGFDRSNAVAIGPKGDVYLSGLFQGTILANGQKFPKKGATDMFVAKFDKNGSFVFVKTYHGTTKSAHVICNDAISDRSGTNIYFTGEFYIGAKFESKTLTPSGDTDTFVLKISNTGSLVWVRSLGSKERDAGVRLALGAIDKVYALGNFEGSLVHGTKQYKSKGSRDFFIAGLDSGSGSISKVHTFGGTRLEHTFAFGMDGLERAYAGGYFSGQIVFGGTTITASKVGLRDIFVARIHLP